MAAGTLLLVDGTGLFYRSFYAIKGLTSRDGRPTNAVYGFVRAVHQMQAIWHPTHMAVAWDSGAPKERLTLLPDYKAQRPPMPDALRGQYDFVREFLDRARIPLIRIDHQEADDILATLAKRADAQADQVLIASADKDLYQLVTERTAIVSTGKDEVRTGPAGVMEKTGVRPDQIVDWLALTGDSVDNIPGVDGLGPKTAARLLAQFGNLAMLWARIAEVEPVRLRDKLLAARDVVDRNLRLVRLIEDLDGVPDWETSELHPERPEQMRAFYEEMEFHSLIRQAQQGELF